MFKNKMKIVRLMVGSMNFINEMCVMWNLFFCFLLMSLFAKNKFVAPKKKS